MKTEVLTRSKFCSLSIKKEKLLDFGNYLQHIYMDESTETSTKKRKRIEEPPDKVLKRHAVPLEQTTCTT